LRIALLSEQEAGALEDAVVGEREGGQPDGGQEDEALSPAGDEAEEREEDWRPCPGHRQRAYRKGLEPNRCVGSCLPVPEKSVISM
jgi:hypothetical protein